MDNSLACYIIDNNNRIVIIHGLPDIHCLPERPKSFRLFSRCVTSELFFFFIAFRIYVSVSWQLFDGVYAEVYFLLRICAQFTFAKYCIFLSYSNPSPHRCWGSFFNSLSTNSLVPMSTYLGKMISCFKISS